MPKVSIGGGDYDCHYFYIETDLSLAYSHDEVVEITDAEYASYLEVDRLWKEKQDWLERLEKQAEQSRPPVPPREPTAPPPWAKHFTITRKDIIAPVSQVIRDNQFPSDAV